MRNFTWNRFPIKNLLIDSLLTPIVESTYLNCDIHVSVQNKCYHTAYTLPTCMAISVSTPHSSKAPFYQWNTGAACKPGMLMSKRQNTEPMLLIYLTLEAEIIIEDWCDRLATTVSVARQTPTWHGLPFVVKSIPLLFKIMSLIPGEKKTKSSPEKLLLGNERENYKYNAKNWPKSILNENGIIKQQQFRNYLGILNNFFLFFDSITCKLHFKHLI